MKAKEIVNIGILLCLGVIFKFIWDILLEKALFLLFFDPFLLISVLIFFKYPKLRIVLAVGIIQTVFSAVFFMTTDIWFIRPVVVLISFAMVLWLREKKWRPGLRYGLACAFTGYLSLLTLSAALLLFLNFIPALFPMDMVHEQFESTLQQYSGLIGESAKQTFQQALIPILNITLGVLGVLYGILPAGFHLAMGLLFYRVGLQRFLSSAVHGE